MAHLQERIVVVLRPAQKAEIRAEAGTMPLSRWIKSQILGSRADRVRALLRGCGDGEMEAVLGAIQEVLAEEKPK